MQNDYIISCDGELYHWGIKGMKWGGYVGIRMKTALLLLPVEDDSRMPIFVGLNVRLTRSLPKQRKLLRERERELDAYGKELLKLPGARKSDGRLSAQTVNAYNRKMAELMSQKTSDLRAPSVRVVSFVAKRGEIGVFMSLSNSGYDPNQYKQGVYSSGRIAYKKDHANKINI